MTAQSTRVINQRRAMLASLLAGVDMSEMRRASPQTLPSSDRASSPRQLRYDAMLIFAAIALLVAAAAASGGVPGAARRETNEILRLVPNPARGAEIFSYCEGCHDSPSNGLPEGWVPSIRGQHPRYLAKQLIDYRRSLRWDARMEPVAQGHGLRGAQDIADVVAFLSAQPSDWGTEDEGTAPTEDSKFYRNHCSGCHGVSGEGNDARYVPRIAGQDFAYLLRQMHDVVDGRRPNMRKEHFGALEKLDVVQLVSLSCFISHLGGGARSDPTEVMAGNRTSSSKGRGTSLERR
jgi:cytochrome c553